MKRFVVTACVLSLMLGIGAAHASNSLTRVYVHHVNSSKGGTEVIPQGGSWTARDHGGATFQIVTDEIGYGHGAQARLLGTPLREVKYESLCNVGGRLGSCPRGATIIGHRSTWDASGRDGGNFEVVVFPNGFGSSKRATLQIR
ncbi:uncharacterized protein DUF4879 [Luteibacter sp. OK325]|uniref:DUF4879 domain-containing protein n=1 Tax=Luteibacter sp. OK325 TaxID=2135670 RepID=UPI000D4BD09E|nr:DUF4879 domain-containing protein [Luteibacter sp. OK325]PTR34755.1 uncharacterized protein DUF4879 [Luteibacter sp. OK325]